MNKFLVPFFAAIICISVTASSAATPVIRARPEPVGKTKRLRDGPVVGGRPEMPAQFRRTDPDEVETAVVAKNLEVPWALEFGPRGRLFFTERPGRVKVIDLSDSTAAPKTWLNRKATLAWGEGGLMGLALDPDFEVNGWIYLSETYGSSGNPKNRIFRVRKNSAGGTVETEVLVDGMPAASYHNGSRLAFGPDGYLYATMGEAGRPERAQDLTSWGGKLLRLTRVGRPAPGNPFDGAGASPYVYAYGLRNSQGIDWAPGGAAYASDHGPSGEFGLGGNDEINRIVKGGNYGWPQAVGAPGLDEYIDPLLLFPDPHLPPAQVEFYDAGLIDGWQGDLFVCSLRGELLLRVVLEERQPVRIERLFEQDFFEGRFGRLRGLTTGPSGALYFSTSNRDGRGEPHPTDDRILRIVPADPGESVD